VTTLEFLYHILNQFRGYGWGMNPGTMDAGNNFGWITLTFILVFFIAMIVGIFSLALRKQ
jgi:hypothetical protein